MKTVFYPYLNPSAATVTPIGKRLLILSILTPFPEGGAIAAANRATEELGMERLFLFNYLI